MPDILGNKAGLAELPCYGVKCGLRAGIKERESILNFERSGGDDSRPAKLARIENVDHRTQVLARALREETVVELIGRVAREAFSA